VREEKRYQKHGGTPSGKIKNSIFHFCLFSLGIWSEMKKMEKYEKIEKNRKKSKKFVSALSERKLLI
jgi:hypothetical protein